MPLHQPIPLWVVLAVGGAILWGLQYSLYGRMGSLLGPAPFMFWYSLLSAVGFGIVMIFQKEGLQLDKLLTPYATFLVLSIVLLGIVANLGILHSMGLKNTTVVAMIEASYPVFTGFFVWLLFREVQFTWLTLLGLSYTITGIGLVAISQKS